MFNSDNPINGSSSDLLHRALFAKQLAKAILSYTSIDNFTIGLCGKWGCGKTSIINMAIEEIAHITSNQTEESPIIVEFNPWNYSDRSQLISQFFATILSKLKGENKDDKIKAIGDCMKKYADVFEYTSFIPIVGQYIAPVSKLIGGAGEHISETIYSHNDITYQKKQVAEALKNQNHKFVIVIDDIDRLNNDQIRLIFQLVNSLAGFPNIIYLLSFDKDVVVRALGEEQNCNGEEYLEKIIQVPFEVPPVDTVLLTNIFFERIAQVHSSFQFTPFKTSEQNYWIKIRDNCIIPFLTNVRDINRIINLYKFKYGLLHNETNWIDLLALTVLQICASPIANWIHQNILHLVGVPIHIGSSLYKEQEINEKYMTQFKEIYPKDPQLMLRVLQTLFPRFSHLTNGDYMEDETNDELRYKQRIASKERCWLYFNLDLEQVVITKEAILTSIHNGNAKWFEKYTDELIDNGHINNYLYELRGYAAELNEDNAPVFLNSMFRLYNKLAKLDNKSNYLASPLSSLYSTIMVILENLNSDVTFNIIQYELEHDGIDEIGILAYILVYLENNKSNRVIIQSSQLNVLEDIFLGVIHRLSDEYNLLDIDSFNVIAILWKKINNGDYLYYIKKQLRTKSNIPKFLYAMVGVWSGDNDERWEFDEDKFSDAITPNEAYAGIVSLKNTQEFRRLQIQFQEICVAFYIYYQYKMAGERKIICRSEIDPVIVEWL